MPTQEIRKLIHFCLQLPLPKVTVLFPFIFQHHANIEKVEGVALATNTGSINVLTKNHFKYVEYKEGEVYFELSRKNFDQAWINQILNQNYKEWLNPPSQKCCGFIMECLGIFNM